jgi:hypothetical protein
MVCPSLDSVSRQQVNQVICFEPLQGWPGAGFTNPSAKSVSDNRFQRIDQEKVNRHPMPKFFLTINLKPNFQFS